MDSIRMEYSYYEEGNIGKSYSFRKLKPDKSFICEENLLALLEINHKNDKGEYVKTETHVLVKKGIFKVTYESKSKNTLGQNVIERHSEFAKLADIRSLKEGCQYYKGTKDQDEILEYWVDIELVNGYKFIQFKEGVLCDKSSREAVLSFIEAIKAQPQ